MNPIDPTPAEAESSPFAEDYRTSVENAVQRLADAGHVTVDGEQATLNASGIRLLQDLVIGWCVQTFGVNVKAVRLAHLTGVAFGSTLVAANNSFGPAAEAERSYQQALTAVRHLGKTLKQ